MTIFGWDASNYDWDRGPMDFAVAKADGITFFTHKLTEMGTEGTYVHRFGDAAVRAHQAGFKYIGAYVVPRSGVSVVAQTNKAIQEADRQWPAWRSFPGFFWQVDSENWGYDFPPLSVGTEMCRLFEMATGKKAVHYASVGHYGPAWNQPYPRWNPNYYLWQRVGHYRSLYTQSGGDTGPGWTGSARIWQYSDSAIIGRQGTCDANAFKGTEEDFARMIGATSVSTTDDFVSHYLQ